MKRLTYFLFCIGTLLLSSCVYSLFPIYTKDTLVYNELIEGTYQDQNSTITITSTPRAKRSTLNIFGGKKNDDKKLTTQEQQNMLLDNKRFGGYKLVIEENDDVYKYQVHLVEIGAEYYLNMTYLPDENGDNDEFVMSNYLYPLHTFMKVSFDQNQLSLTQFDASKLRDLFRKNMIRLRHEVVTDPISEEDSDNGEIIITAQPEEIQKFIRTYSKDPSVFDKTQIYKRV